MSRYLNLESALCKEMDKIDEKYRNGAEMSEGDLRRIDLLTHSLKSLRCYAEKREADDMQRMAYENGNSYYTPNTRYMSQNQYYPQENNRRW